MNTLQDIRRDQSAYLRDGRLSDRESRTLMARLDDLNSQIRWDRRGLGTSGETLRAGFGPRFAGATLRRHGVLPDCGPAVI